MKANNNLFYLQKKIERLAFNMKEKPLLFTFVVSVTQREIFTKIFDISENSKLNFKGPYHSLFF